MRAFFTAKALEGNFAGEIEKRTFSAEGAPNITRYWQSESKEDYRFVLVVNNSEDKAYRESTEISGSPDLKLMAPESGSRFDIQVEPGQQKCVIIRAAVGGAGYQHTSYAEV